MIKRSLQQIAEESESSQNSTELAFLLEDVSVISPKVIVEIGVDRGGSIKTWFEAFSPDVIIGIENGTADQVFVPNCRIVRGDSQDPRILEHVKSVLGERQIDFLFIDGDHTYKAVKKDFELYAPLVRRGGMIAFHDIGLDPVVDSRWVGLVEVKTLWEEIRDKYKYREYRSETGTGTGVIWHE